MNIEKLTHKAQEVIQEAQNIALDRDHQTLTPHHLLGGLLATKDTAVAPLLARYSVPLNQLEQDNTAALATLPSVSGSGQFYADTAAAKILRNAEKWAESLNDSYVAAEHLLGALADSATPAGQLLTAKGLNKKAIETALRDIRGTENIKSKSAESGVNVLEKYTLNLIQQAQNGKLDPVIGRDDEIRRVIQILCRRTKNNPVLIGEPGVGKTAIVEGLAQRIVSGDVPELLKGKQLVALDMGTLIAGAKYRGEFEDRLKAIIKEIAESNGDIILFIDEMHTLVGAGASEGAMDAANLLKPALARGELRCIGATTLAEYRKYVEKDAALERRFQKTVVAEPDTHDTVAILRGLKEKYELHHGVKILDAAIIAAAQLSHRYIADRFLPDKAIDLVDEAAAKLRIEVDSMPLEIDEIERKIIQLEIEKQALLKDASDSAELQALDQQLANLKESSAHLKSHWQNEKSVIDDLNGLKEKIERAKHDEQVEERNANFEKVSEIRFQLIPGLTQQIDEKRAELASIQKDRKMLKEEVGPEDIAGVISKWTGIPATKLIETEREKLLAIQDTLSAQVIGQETAVEKVANAVRRSRSGLSAPGKPLASFIFLGPTGVGKTELAKTLARTLFDSDKHMIRIDMSEYMEKHAVSRLIGAPPGYVGYDQGGQLTEAIRRRPYSVILLDEIEKAHPDALNILLQVLDDGRLTDGQGRQVDFSNAIIIMTSNIGSELLLDTVPVADELLQDALLKFFRPEFLNRIDDIITFNSLDETHMARIIRLQLAQLDQRLKEKSIQLDVSESAVQYIALKAYNPQFGARPLKRFITDAIENELAIKLLSHELPEGATISLDYQEGFHWAITPLKPVTSV